MNAQFNASRLGASPDSGKVRAAAQETMDHAVYVKPVAVSTLPDFLREQAGELETIFAVHDADGQQIALVADRDLAFVLARQHDKVPMTVH